MSEEQNESTWSGLMKTIIGTIATLITAGGAWLGSQLFGGDEPTVAQPQQQTPVINIVNQNQSQSNSGGTTKVIERVVEKPVEKPTEKKKEVVKKKEGDEFKNEEPKW